MEEETETQEPLFYCATGYVEQENLTEEQIAETARAVSERALRDLQDKVPGATVSKVTVRFELQLGETQQDQAQD